jgi:hypothetical protein
MNEQTLDLAKDLASSLLQDINIASTRVEHIRLTARANEAAKLVTALEKLLTDAHENS